MFKIVMASFLSLCLLFPVESLAIACENPFAKTISQFQLVEALNCNGVTSPVNLQITAENTSVTPQDPYLAPGCDLTSVYFNLNQGPVIVDFSDSIADAHSKVVKVNRACDGAVLFVVDREPKLITLPSGRKVNTSVRVFAADNSQTLLAYSLVSEDGVNKLVLRNIDESIASTAVKTFTSSANGNQCAAIWTVKNNVGTEQMATVVSFLLTLKDNIDFTCSPTVPPQSSSVSPATIALSVVCSVVVVTAGFGGFLYWLKNRARNKYVVVN